MLYFIAIFLAKCTYLFANFLSLLNSLSACLNSSVILSLDVFMTSLDFLGYFFGILFECSVLYIKFFKWLRI